MHKLPNQFPSLPGIAVEVCRADKGCEFACFDVAGLANFIKQRLDEKGLPEQLRARVKGPFLNHNVFKISLSGCPNCCSQPQIKDIGLHGFTQVKIEETHCLNCGDCVSRCKEGAIVLNDISATVDRHSCIRCGECVKVCPLKVIKPEYNGIVMAVGGKLGRHPRLARPVFTGTDPEEIWREIEWYISLLLTKGVSGERLGDLLERTEQNGTDIRPVKPGIYQV